MREKEVVVDRCVVQCLVSSPRGHILIMELSPSPVFTNNSNLDRHHSHLEFPMSPLIAKSEGSSPFYMDKNQSRFFKSNQPMDTSRFNNYMTAFRAKNISEVYHIF